MRIVESIHEGCCSSWLVVTVDRERSRPRRLRYGTSGGRKHVSIPPYHEPRKLSVALLPTRTSQYLCHMTSRRDCKERTLGETSNSICCYKSTRYGVVIVRHTRVALSKSILADIGKTTFDSTVGTSKPSLMEPFTLQFPSASSADAL